MFFWVSVARRVFSTVSPNQLPRCFFSLFRDSVLQHGLCVLLAMIAFVAVEAFVAAALCLC